MKATEVSMLHLNRYCQHDVAGLGVPAQEFGAQIPQQGKLNPKYTIAGHACERPGRLSSH
jgi:hypothetical protein